jgi:hypothetical protein
MPCVAARSRGPAAAAGNGAERGGRDGAAVVPVGLGCIIVMQLTAEMRILVAMAIESGTGAVAFDGLLRTSWSCYRSINAVVIRGTGLRIRHSFKSQCQGMPERGGAGRRWQW